MDMLDEKTKEKLRAYAKQNKFNENTFIFEVEQAKGTGMPIDEAIPYVERMFARGAFDKKPKDPTLANFTPERLKESAPWPQPAPGPKEITVTVPPTPTTTAYDKLVELVGYHLAEIYGVRGTGKSRLVHSIAVEAQEAGKRVLFLDTEGGLNEKHVKQLKNYEYIGDELEDLTKAVSQAKDHRGNYDLLIVDSVGHPVYVNYVTMGGMDEKLKSYQELATLFRDMVRFSRGEKGKDMGKRFALSIAVDHTVSEFARIAKDLPTEAPLDPFGGQIHRVPKLIVRSEPVEFTSERSIFKLLTWKARDLPKNLEIAHFGIDSKGLLIDWKI